MKDEGGKGGANTRAIAHITRERQMCSPGWATVAKRSTEAREAEGRSPKREGSTPQRASRVGQSRPPFFDGRDGAPPPSDSLRRLAKTESRSA